MTQNIIAYVSDHVWGGMQMGMHDMSTSECAIAIYPRVWCTGCYHPYKCKNLEVRCRDDTVPKTVDTRRHCMRACNNLPQPPKTKDVERGKFVACSQPYLAVPSYIYSF